MAGVPSTSLQDGIRLCQPVALSSRPGFSTAMPSEPVVPQTGETATCGAQLAHSVKAQTLTLTQRRCVCPKGDERSRNALRKKRHRTI